MSEKMSKIISALLTSASVLAPLCAKAQEIPRFPLTTSSESPDLFFVQRYNGVNFYSEKQTIGTTFDLVRGLPNDASRTTSVGFFNVECAPPGRFRQFAGGTGVTQDEVNANMAAVNGGWKSLTENVPAAQRAKMACLTWDLSLLR
jgi:hypothetical protein